MGAPALVADGGGKGRRSPWAPPVAPGKSRRAAPPPIFWSVRGGQGRHRQGSGCGGGAAGRGAGVLLSCIFSRLQRRNFSAGSGAGAPASQRLPRAAGRGGERRTSQASPLGSDWAMEPRFSLPLLPYYVTGLPCSPREIPSFPLGPARALGLLELQARGVT